MVLLHFDLGSDLRNQPYPPKCTFADSRHWIPIISLHDRVPSREALFLPCQLFDILPLTEHIELI
jgi:hypothetical protein